MTIREKIEKKEQQIANAQARISADQGRIAQLKKEIKELQSLEVQNVLDELHISFDVAMEQLRSMRPSGEDQEQ